MFIYKQLDTAGKQRCTKKLDLLSLSSDPHYSPIDPRSRNVSSSGFCCRARPTDAFFSFLLQVLAKKRS